jgi:glycosyltransferase involved in cell wall biosynthesis
MTGESLGGAGKWRARRDKVPLLAYPQREVFSTWSNGWWPGRVAMRINAQQADVVHLHWTGHGFLSLGELAKINAPLVWTMHDFWAFTGGCHYPDECRRFVSGCGSCPQLASKGEHDLSRWNQKRKRALMVGVVRNWIAPSDWIAGMARQSGRIDVDRVRVVKNTVPTEVFNPGRRESARARLGIADGEMVMAAGSFELDEPRKGNHLLPAALAEWRKRSPGLPARLVIFGAKKPPSIDVGGLVVTCAGVLKSDGEVADLLAAADVFLLPSLQDNLPNVAAEAQACGCVVVGFDAGGLGEIIQPESTGILVTEKNGEALGVALARFTEMAPSERSCMAEASRRRAEMTFAADSHAKALLGIYREIAP